MDRIEQFFEKNKGSFDQLKADDSIWEGIQMKMQEPAKPVRRTRLVPGWASAAAVLLLIGLLSFLMWPSDSEMPMAQKGLELEDKFPDIALRNQYGELVPLSSLKGKVVLVEFWASYSVVCTEDQCYKFKPVYNEFKDQGFEIYAVSVDSSAASWVEVIEKDQEDWVHVSDLQGEQSPMQKLLDGEELPITYLLDEDGKIIAKNINADDLKDKLDQLFAYNK